MYTFFVAKKDEFDNESKKLFFDLKDNLGIAGIESVRQLNRYDIKGVSPEDCGKAAGLILAEAQTDEIYTRVVPGQFGKYCFGVRYLPVQFDQRADSAIACIKLLTGSDQVEVVSSKVIFLDGDISEEDFKRIKSYCINPVDSCEISLETAPAFGVGGGGPGAPEVLAGFISKSRGELETLVSEMGLAMAVEDLEFCQAYFKRDENRNPTVTEIRVIDTYWSDHCRHTTFAANLKLLKIEKGLFSEKIQAAYDDYIKTRRDVYGEAAESRPLCLMDIATIGMKYLRREGYLEDLDESEEVNACGIKIDVETDGMIEPWVLMFKNETHNHPTEIEPFGGAATCIGGAIRDPLAGRGYVFGAMRITGSADPRVSVGKTPKGKLPQRKITRGALDGFSSYGNQIGLATGKVKEFYHPGFAAKRLECGAVLGAAPLRYIRRETPEEGDVVVLVGGRTGKDGIGGATGSSKNHDEKSLESGGSEVQKGNAVTERKIQRFFRSGGVTRLIKRCNDFGAGGVAVAVGELCPGLDIDLDKVPLKYQGLDATEIAISESQERMAVVVEEQDLNLFLELARAENLEAAKIADVTSSNRLRIFFRGQLAVDLSRSFLDTSGVRQDADVIITAEKEAPYFEQKEYTSLEQLFINTMTDLNNCSSRGMTEQFDATIGAGTVIHPLGGKYQASENDALVIKLPIKHGNSTDTAAYMACGCNPDLMEYSPYLGAQYAVIESLAKIAASGANSKMARLSFQEYFEKMGKAPERWGKPAAALLGALEAQKKLRCAAIGGKDSMSGSFNELDVPPTLISFAVAPGKASLALSQDIKPKEDTKLVLVSHVPSKDGAPDYANIRENLELIYRLARDRRLYAAASVGSGGLVKALANMCYGNHMGVKINHKVKKNALTQETYGSFVVQIDKNISIQGSRVYTLGEVIPEFEIRLDKERVNLETVQKADYAALESVFPTKAELPESAKPEIKDIIYRRGPLYTPGYISGHPRVLIPAFPGTNCEYDMRRRFKMAGGDPDVFVFRNITPKDIDESIYALEKMIRSCKILALPGGFSLGDEPDGSAKFIAAVFRNERVNDAVNDLLQNRDGLVIGICNGFQALIKLGLVPYGTVVEPSESGPTLTFNAIGRHLARYVSTKIVSNLSPWLASAECEKVYSVPVSHGEGRLVISPEDYRLLLKNGQVATVYTDFEGNPSYDIGFNPNGSYYAIEGITSPDGRVFGKMAHSERIGENVCKNIPGLKDQKIFEAGIAYFR
ncbi:MAG: phosphoribosylformylglycinamidine synthase [Oscillospiraceae bacterium]|jgi:phosphoribosylformylglycinamidine synthase|nr:phosphoribosylformylglycinamidine synthase [Oscillospiraceae bacterium]